MRTSRRHTRRTSTGALVAATCVLALAGGVGTGAAMATLADPDGGAAPTPVVTHAPALEPPTIPPTQELLLEDGDPNACAVSFAGEGVTDAPHIARTGGRYLSLPIPRAEGRVFAGWYASEDAAATRDVASRINGADLVTCDARREVTLHAAWMTPDDLAADTAQVPILMYHQFTDKPEGEDGWLKLNFYDIGAWADDMRYIHDGGFYLPTWDELDAFIDGALWLPRRSVIVTDDDADSTWLSMAVPIAAEEQVLTTSFVITKYRHEPTPSIWVQQRSHTDDMHEAGENGKGRMVNWTPEEISADLERSAEILGATEVIAYPYGHYDDRSKEGVAAAGFDLAVTVDHGYVTVGSDKLALPRIRMNWGMTVDDLADAIG